MYVTTTLSQDMTYCFLILYCFLSIIIYIKSLIKLYHTISAIFGSDRIFSKTASKGFRNIVRLKGREKVFLKELLWFLKKLIFKLEQKLRYDTILHTENILNAITYSVET